MSLRNPFGWDLPPGCTDKDIDNAFGDPDTKTCKTCNDEFEPEDDDQVECEHCRTHSHCCDVKFDQDIRICPKCKENV